MNNRQEHLETLHEIRSLMEQSARFISLSGLSGVVAGFAALVGAAMVYVYTETTPFGYRYYYASNLTAEKWGMDYLTFFVLDASLVLVCALGAGLFFTQHRAKEKGQKIWDALTQRLLYHLMLPLVTGGVFCLGLIYQGFVGFVAPATLVFYGLALINASKFTLKEIHYLGILEIILGLVALFFMGYGLEFWSVGFGFLHIFYGLMMYAKYEKTKKI